VSDDAQKGGLQGPHPLATALARSLAPERPGARVLVLGAGRGRSLPVLVDAGFAVDAVDADADVTDLKEPYDAILSSHALLHGTRASVVERLHVLADVLTAGGLLHATFGSASDPRCGRGTAVAGGGWVPVDGPEAGVAHAYFDRAALLDALGDFDVLSAAENDVSEVVGRWAHDPSATPIIHWFVIASKRGPAARGYLST
jgi:hypothetical protein